MFQRSLISPLSQSFFLFGARGTGKTTWVQNYFPPEKILYLNLLLPRLEQQLSLRPDDLEAMVKDTTCEWIVLDEIQKIPKLLDMVHYLIEKEKIKFILTGSSARKLKRGGANLLAGRAVVREMYPFSVKELGNVFELDKTLNFGSLPKIYELNSDFERIDYLESYAQLFLREEIAAEQLVRKIDPFRKFLEVAAQANGKIINYSTIAKITGVDVKSVQTYFQILEDTHLGFILEPWIPSVRERVMKHPKFYFFDLGVCRSLARQLETKITPSTSLYGELFEQWLILEVHRWSRYFSRNTQLFYFQNHNGNEIDLIIHNSAKRIILVEIKSCELVEEKHLHSLVSLRGLFSNPRCICVSKEQNRKIILDVECLPWQEFLQELHVNLE